MRILVTGAGGFIGHHLVKRLKADGHWVHGVDIKYPEYENTAADDFVIADLRDYVECSNACSGIDEVYNLAADMGGIGYITAHLADIARNNTLINVNMLEAARVNKVKKFLFSSSACVYAQNKQHDADVAPLKEEDAYPADPEPGYGWEKLFAEQMCEYYRKDHGLDVRVVRFHNVYGPLGTYDGGREKAPAAVCRKISNVVDGGGVEIWGDGKQTRSFMYIDDCVEGLIRLMDSTYNQPLNLGTDELTTIDGLFDKVAGIAKKSIVKNHDITKPQGVRGRNSDNTKLSEVLNWEPKIPLDEGLKKTYEWIALQLMCDQSAKRWDRDQAEHKHRITYPLANDSLVYDVGGYKGGWSAEINKNYKCNIHIFEPVAEYYDLLIRRFCGDSNVSISEYGLADREFKQKMIRAGSRSSLYIPGAHTTDGWFKDIVDFPVPDLISINIEGGEYDLLRRMIDSGWAAKCQFIQIQFHSFYPKASELRESIRQDLSKTHEERYNYPFAWEAWQKKQP